jgi:hypothetical protein
LIMSKGIEAKRVIVMAFRLVNWFVTKSGTKIRHFFSH